MKRCFIAGNWKMNLCRAESTALAGGIASALGDTPGVDVAVCPPSIYLDAVATTLDGSPVSLGAQDVYFEEQGAFTGELSPSMLCDIGCRYVILGHSERRHVLGEDDTLVNCKLHAALDYGLLPIVCVGETLEQREAGDAESVVINQVKGALARLSTDSVAKVTVAYEPIWAIGTGRTALPEDADSMAGVIRKIVGDVSTFDISEEVRVLYGGSVNPGNIKEFMAKSHIDGALVGGVSLDSDQFAAVVRFWM